MLMDLFFDAASVSTSPADGHRRKQRVHFHSFMLSIHQKMYDLRNEGGDSLPKIARNFVENDAYLLCLDEFQVTDVRT